MTDRAKQNNILRLPCAIAPRAWIRKLIEIGLLRHEDRGNAEAVERAVNTLRIRTAAFVGSEIGGGQSTHRADDTWQPLGAVVAGIVAINLSPDPNAMMERPPCPRNSTPR